jgi:single-strand DNA-binding protein
MSALNKVFLIGHLGRDPELRYTADGSPVATFSLATSEKWSNKGGEPKEHTEWHNIVAWNALADLSKKYLAKGRQVYIEGRIRSNEWTDRDGIKRKKTEIIATSMVLLGSRQDAPAQTENEPKPEARREPGEESFDQSGISDSDIPF